MRFTVAVLCALALAVAVDGNALDDYIAKPDSAYKWIDTGLTLEGLGWKGYVLNMTSQTWLTQNDWHHEKSNQNIWWHWMLVVVPDQMAQYPTGAVWVTGGSNNNGPPSNPMDEDVFLAAALATNMGIVVTTLYMIPNQPIYFNEEQPPHGRSEDGMIAWTWQHFLQHPDQPEWIARLPMVKAVVRAMDTIQVYTKGKGMTIDNFIVAGASKRGWTTWLTGAVDKRIIGLVPIVMDELNFVDNIHHHYRAYGGWSFALEDYYKLNFTRHLDDPNLVKLMAIEDPLVYVDRMKNYPKMVINAAGDEFFLNDDTRWWWDKLPEPKHFMMIPNAEHSLATGVVEAIEGVQAFGNGILQKVTQPTHSWVIDDKTGNITVTIKDTSTLVGVSMWYAYSAAGTGRRDWRLVAGWPKPDLQLVLWTEKKLSPVSTGVYVAHMDMPTTGWVAFFVDVQHHGPTSPFQGPTTFRATSEVSIIPQTFPYDCKGEACYGVLL